MSQPGWYISPTNPEIQHYWDGSRWLPRATAIAPGSSAKPMPSDLPPIPRVVSTRKKKSGSTDAPAWAKIIAGLIVGGVVIAIVIAVNRGDSNSGGSSNGGTPSGGSFAAKEATNAAAATSDTVGLLVELAAADSVGDADAALVQIGADADTLHGHLDDFRQQILGDASVSNDTQYGFLTAENDLKKAVGAVGTWAGNPTTGSASSLLSQMERAVAEWNASASVLWPGDDHYQISLPS